MTRLLPLLLVGCTASQATEAPSHAEVVAVQTSGEPGAYTFAVQVRSPDTGCAQYADWWEIVRPDGTLLYRRILAHSHVSEQPFTRSGGPVAIRADDEVIVRAHLSTRGYGGAVQRGSVAGGWSSAAVLDGFAAHLASADPQPGRCAF